MKALALKMCKTLQKNPKRMPRLYSSFQTLVEIEVFSNGTNIPSDPSHVHFPEMQKKKKNLIPMAPLQSASFFQETFTAPIRAEGKILIHS